MAQTNRDILNHSSGGQKFKIKVSAGPASSETDGGGPFLISQLLAAQESLGWWLNHFPLYLVVHVVSSLCVPSLLLPPKDIIYIGCRTTLPLGDLVLTNYICNSLVFK